MQQKDLPFPLILNEVCRPSFLLIFKLLGQRFDHVQSTSRDLKTINNCLIDGAWMRKFYIEDV